ncbi:MAG: hypothetical protein HY540_08505 [Deltaproteobacteria bacterium]|nr:hypothetical protein [Deltaproteobacteria bacterium]
MFGFKANFWGLTKKAFLLLLMGATPFIAFAQDGTDAEIDQGLFEDARETPQKAEKQILTTDDQGRQDDDEDIIPKIELGEENNVEPIRSIVLDTAIILNYAFDRSSDSFTVKYVFHIEGKATSATALVSGDAEITAQVQGMLSKFATGECKLDVSIPKVPFELMFKKTDEERASISLKFNGAIAETWKSQCTFTQAGSKKFETIGDAERWLAQALEKTSPPLDTISIDLTPDEPTSATFTIGKQSLKDPPLGAAEIEGTGIITVTPRGGS